MLKKLKEIKDYYFLNKHGCDNWEQYYKIYDVDFNIRASMVSHIFHGYKFVHCFENRNHQIYHWGYNHDKLIVISQWCKNNCIDKFRFDFLRVIKNYNNEWVINELGGGDYIFAAFKNEEDFLLFKLKWP